MYGMHCRYINAIVPAIQVQTAFNDSEVDRSDPAAFFMHFLSSRVAASIRGIWSEYWDEDSH